MELTPEIIEALKALEASGMAVTGGNLKPEYDSKKLDDNPSELPAGEKGRL